MSSFHWQMGTMKFKMAVITDLHVSLQLETEDITGGRISECALYLPLTFSHALVWMKSLPDVVAAAACEWRMVRCEGGGNDGGTGGESSAQCQPPIRVFGMEPTEWRDLVRRPSDDFSSLSANLKKQKHMTVWRVRFNTLSSSAFTYHSFFPALYDDAVQKLTVYPIICTVGTKLSVAR